MIESIEDVIKFVNIVVENIKDNLISLESDIKVMIEYLRLIDGKINKEIEIKGE